MNNKLLLFYLFQLPFLIYLYNHLVDQWTDELKNFGYSPYRVYSDVEWFSQLKTQISKLKMMKNTKHLSIVTTNDSFKTPRFKEILNLLLDRFEIVLIADEAHNVGANTIISSLPDKIGYRLGLSATPIRYNDTDGTNKLFNYFGEIIFKFSLKDAIDKGFLTKYYYYPYLVCLDSEESERYYDLIDEFKGYPMEELKRIAFTNQDFKNIIRTTYQIADGSINKFRKFKEVIEAFDDDYYNLVYCSSVKINDGENKLPIKQIDAITAYMGNNLRMRVHTYTDILLIFLILAQRLLYYSLITPLSIFLYTPLISLANDNPSSELIANLENSINLLYSFATKNSSVANILSLLSISPKLLGNVIKSYISA